MSYESDLQYAHDVMRIRNAMVNEELNERHRVFWDYRSNYQYKWYKIHYRGKAGLHGPANFGDVNSSHYLQSDDPLVAGTVITSKSIVFMDNDFDAWVTIGKAHSAKIEEYTEELYFQHSLVYSDEELRALVVASVLKQNPIKVCKHFKIFWDYVPVLTKLLRYADNGII